MLAGSDKVQFSLTFGKNTLNLVELQPGSHERQKKQRVRNTSVSGYFECLLIFPQRKI